MHLRRLKQTPLAQQIGNKEAKWKLVICYSTPIVPSQNNSQCICYQDMDFTRKELITGNFITSHTYQNESDYHLKFGLTGPHSQVICIHFEINSKVLVSGHSDNTIHIWKAFPRNNKTPQQQIPNLNIVQSDWTFDHLQTLFGHTGAVTCLQFDDFKVISGSRDKSIKVWSMETGECQITLSGHNHEISSLAFDEANIYSIDASGEMRSWSFNRSNEQKAVISQEQEQSEKGKKRENPSNRSETSQGTKRQKIQPIFLSENR